MWGFVRDLFHDADPFWTADRVLGGLSSGEGLIEAVRDRVVAEDADGDLKVVDEGAPDKRLLALESEFAGPLKVMTREGNTLSVIVRQAWDGAKLATLTRDKPLKATDPHISVIAHVTRDEVLRRLSETDTLGGFTNRFLWIAVRRSKALPFGGSWSRVDASALVKRLREALEFAGDVGEIAWGGARDLWEEAYEELSGGDVGLFGAATSRGEAQCLRLAAVYAVMDGSRTIEPEHLRAALAVWEYALDSARRIFGEASGDQVADRIIEALRKNQGGMTRSEIRALFSGNKTSARIGQSLERLQALGRVRSETEKTAGRPVERWYAISLKDAKTPPDEGNPS